MLLTELTIKRTHTRISSNTKKFSPISLWKINSKLSLSIGEKFSKSQVRLAPEFALHNRTEQIDQTDSSELDVLSLYLIHSCLIPTTRCPERG